jgi:hypothetical protein
VMGELILSIMCMWICTAYNVNTHAIFQVTGCTDHSISGSPSMS